MAGKKRKRKQKQSDQQETDGPGVEELKRAVEEAKRQIEEAKRQTEESKRQIEEAKRQTEEAKRQTEESKRRREEVEAELAAIEALDKGTYFATYNDLWTMAGKNFSDRDLTFLTRSRRDFGGIMRGDNPYYLRTRDFAENTNYTATVAPTEARSESTTNNRLNWPRHVLETIIVNDSEEADENFTIDPSGELAHLVPTSPNYANLHLYVAPLMFGIPNASLKCNMKLIHGSKEKDGNRENDVGVKHFATNKIRLHGQKNHYEKQPHVLIIPILTVNETKAWNGEGYDALFLIGVKQDEFGTKQEAPTLKEIAAATRLRTSKLTRGETATRDEIEKSRQLLEACILALSYSMQHDVALNTEFWNGIPDPVRRQVGCLPSLDKAPCPRQKRGEKPRVLKVRFCSVTADVGNHPAPDPMLLAMKAANNWSAAHGVRLLAVEEESEEDKMSDRSVLALEMHMEWVREAQQHERNQEIGGMEIVCGM